MKKFLTLKNIVVVSGFALALAVFVMSFFARFTLDLDGTRASFIHIVWGSDYLVAPGYDPIPIKAEIGADRCQPSVLLLVGNLLVIVGALAAALVTLFVNKPWAKWVVVGSAALVLAGAVMQFFAIPSFMRAMTETVGKVEGLSREQINQRYNEIMSEMSKYNPAIGVSVAAGVVGVVAALGLGASQFLPEKK